MRPTLDRTMLEVAAVLARRSTCVKKAVGCVLVDARGRILGTGYNGRPAGMPHCNQREHVPTGYHPPDEHGVEFVKGMRWELSHACNGGRPFPSGADLCEAVHAEQNALLQCRDPDLVRTAYCTHAPCLRCAKTLLNTGCRTVMFSTDYPDEPQAGELWLRAGRNWVKE